MCIYRSAKKNLSSFAHIPVNNNENCWFLGLVGKLMLLTAWHVTLSPIHGVVSI